MFVFFFYCCHRVICQLTAESLSGTLSADDSNGPDSHSQFCTAHHLPACNEYAVCLLARGALQKGWLLNTETSKTIGGCIIKINICSSQKRVFFFCLFLALIYLLVQAHVCIGGILDVIQNEVFNEISVCAHSFSQILLAVQ